MQERKTRKNRIPLVLLASVVLAGCQSPWTLLPGGALDGKPEALSSDWSFLREIEVIQLETNPSEPYSVNLWIIALDGNLYVHAGTNRATWVENIETDPRVRVQADESLYALRATRVESQAEFDRFSGVYEEKYGNPPRSLDAREAYLFRLAPLGPS